MRKRRTIHSICARELTGSSGHPNLLLPPSCPPMLCLFGAAGWKSRAQELHSEGCAGRRQRRGEGGLGFTCGAATGQGVGECSVIFFCIV